MLMPPLGSFDKQGPWLSQSYPIIIEVAQQVQGDGQPNQGAESAVG